MLLWAALTAALPPSSQLLRRRRGRDRACARGTRSPGHAAWPWCSPPFIRQRARRAHRGSLLNSFATVVKIAPFLMLLVGGAGRRSIPSNLAFHRHAVPARHRADVGDPRSSPSSGSRPRWCRAAKSASRSARSRGGVPRHRSIVAIVYLACTSSPRRAGPSSRGAEDAARGGGRRRRWVAGAPGSSSGQACSPSSSMQEG